MKYDIILKNEKAKYYKAIRDLIAVFNLFGFLYLVPVGSANFLTLKFGIQESPTEKRNDITHLKMLVPIVRNFLMELVTNCAPESKREQRDIIHHFKKLQRASETGGIKKGFRKAGVKLADAIPAAHIRRSELDTLKSFLANTFMPAISGKTSGNPPG